MINLDDFIEEKNLKFESQKQGLSWVRRNLKLKTLLQVGPNYLLDKFEADPAYDLYLQKQKEIFLKKQQRARVMAEVYNKRRREKKRNRMIKWLENIVQAT